ncbi:transposable element Tc3 transposase [Trichonephila clavipes]|nr:transposable element Tc3 transposase [Trichonephila clavipes]
MNSITERRVIHQVKIDPKISAPKIAASTSNTLGRSVSAETVRGVLRKAGYNVRVAQKKPLIGKRNRVKRLKFAKEHIFNPQHFGTKSFSAMREQLSGDSVVVVHEEPRPQMTGTLLQARSNRRQTAGEIARHTKHLTGRPIPCFTVARRLHGGGLFARRPVRFVPLTAAHRRRRSLWCREHRNWRDNEWGRVLFTDESRFSLSSDSHCILIWRERRSRNDPSNIIERDRYGGRGVLVWGGIMFGSRTDLHIFDAGSVNGTRYCNEILRPYVRLFRGAMGLQFLFMDDNAPCHRTVASEQLL